jgi:CubicO group peptidase (beta-lactamase class C family)
MLNLTRRRAGATLLAAALPTGFTNASAQDWLGQARTALAPGGPIEADIDELARANRFAGAALAAVDGQPVLAKAWGAADRENDVPNTLSTRFNIASAGKMFTAVGVGRLIEAGEVRLNDPLSRHLPDLPREIAARVTIEQLLAHTSGLGSYFASPLWPQRRDAIRSASDFVELVRGETLQHEPGSAFLYSNSGYVLLGAAIERVTGMDYDAAMRQLVFEPAGMTRTGYPIFSENHEGIAIGYENGCFGRPPQQCTPSPLRDARSWWGARGSPAGGGVSTAGDLLAFVQALRTGRLLRPDTFALMRSARTPMDRPGGPIDAYGLGFGRLAIHGRATWGHNGGTPGAQAQVDAFEDAPLALIVLCNVDGGQRPASAALRRAAAN